MTYLFKGSTSNDWQIQLNTLLRCYETDCFEWALSTCIYQTMSDLTSLVLCKAKRAFWWAQLNIFEFIFVRFTWVKLMINPPPIETARALSELYALQCHQWELIQNGQLIGIYKEIPVQRKWWLSPLPPFETARALSNGANKSPSETVN